MNDEANLQVLCLCADCGCQLNSTHWMTEADLRESWRGLVLSQPLNTRACPRGCRPTYADVNANVTLVVKNRDGVEVAFNPRGK